MNSNLLSITGYNLFRKDRVIGRGGGVCAYIKNDIPRIRGTDLECENLECLWLSLRPKRLPGPFSGIVICVVYHPPGRTSSEHNDLNEHVINTIDLVRNLHPDHGLVILGDFNDFEIRTLIRSHNLKQAVGQPTRESTILDLIITNLHKLYDNPTVLTPLGSSDHNIIHWVASINSNPGHNTEAQSVKSLVGRYLNRVLMLLEDGLPRVIDFVTLNPIHLLIVCTSHMTDSIDRIFPQQKATRHHTDKPRITPEIKQLIKRRQRHFIVKTQLYGNL